MSVSASASASVTVASATVTVGVLIIIGSSTPALAMVGPIQWLGIVRVMVMVIWQMADHMHGITTKSTYNDKYTAHMHTYTHTCT
jgi:predicted transcriptional regulator